MLFSGVRCGIGRRVLAEVVNLDEPVVENCLGTVVGPSSLKRSGKLNESSFRVSSVPHLWTEREKYEERRRETTEFLELKIWDTLETFIL